MRNNLPTLFCFLLLIYSCDRWKGSPDKEGRALLIDDQHLSQVLSIDSFIIPGSFRVVALAPAVNDSLHISSLEFKLATEDAIIFYDETHSTLEIFDQDGKFRKELKLNQLIGSGIYLSDIRNNPFTKQLDLLDRSGKVYSLSIDAGAPVVVKNYTAYHPSLFLPISKDGYIFYNNFERNDGKPASNRFYALDHGTAVKSWWPFDTSLVFIVSVFNRQFSQVGGKSRFFDPVYPVIYNVTDTGLAPLYSMKYRQFNLKTKDVLDIASIVNEVRHMNIPCMNYFIDSDRYCLFELGVNKHPLSCICDKETGQSVGVGGEGFGIEKIGMILYNPVYEGDTGELFTTVEGRDIQRLLKKAKYEELKGLDSVKGYDKVLVSFRLK